MKNRIKIMKNRIKKICIEALKQNPTFVYKKNTDIVFDLIETIYSDTDISLTIFDIIYICQHVDSFFEDEIRIKVTIDKDAIAKDSILLKHSINNDKALSERGQILYDEVCRKHNKTSRGTISGYWAEAFENGILLRVYFTVNNTKETLK